MGGLYKFWQRVCSILKTNIIVCIKLQCKPEDCINVDRMNVSDGGKQPFLRDTEWNGQIQKMTLDDGRQKGMRCLGGEVCLGGEGSRYREDEGQSDASDDFICDGVPIVEVTTDCCHRLWDNSAQPNDGPIAVCSCVLLGMAPILLIWIHWKRGIKTHMCPLPNQFLPLLPHLWMWCTC